MNHLVAKAYSKLKQENHPLLEVVYNDLTLNVRGLSHCLSLFGHQMDNNLSVFKADNAEKLTDFITNNLDDFKLSVDTALKATVPNNFVEDNKPSIRKLGEIYDNMLTYYQSQKSNNPQTEAMNYYTEMLLDYLASSLLRKHRHVL